jgi:adenylate cyclase
MNRIITGKLRLLGEFCLFGAFAGIMYQLVESRMVDYRSILMGIPVGFAYGIMDLFVLSGFSKQFMKMPLALTILLKAFIYLFVIYFITGGMGFIVGLSEGKQMEEWYQSLVHKDQLILIIYTLSFYILLAFYTHINLLLGEGALLKFLLGKYRKPSGEHRIFMFLDLKSSTTLAERLGLENYYSLLNDFFHEISEPVRSTNAEIYQYVGDEVVLTWKTKEGIDNSNCLKIFFEIQEKVYANRKYYRSKYGVIPEFKAGVHIGKVISAQIGDIKREIVYNGDVLNTSARIQEQCNVLKRELLLSGMLLNQLNIENEYTAEKLDNIKLRGKENLIEIYSLKQF